MEIAKAWTGMTRALLVAAVLMGTLLAAAAPQALADDYPGIQWSTYIGGDNNGTTAYGTDEARCVAVDSGGNVWVGGVTDCDNFPGAGTPPEPFSFSGFIAKLSPTGSPLWTSYIGGSRAASETLAVAVDQDGNCWVLGNTHASDFPVEGGFQTQRSGGCDYFVAKLSPTGELVWSSYLGGVDPPYGVWGNRDGGIVLDSTGDVWLLGETNSVDFPTPGGFSHELNLGTTPPADTPAEPDGYLAKISPSGQLLWGSYIGGSGYEMVFNIAIDNGNNILVSGLTVSSDLPGDTGTGDRHFVMKLTGAGQIAWVSPLPQGWAGYWEFGHSLTTDASGNIWLAGDAFGGTFPTMGPGPDGDPGTNVGSLIKMAPTGEILWGRCIQGSESTFTFLNTVAIDEWGNAWVGGETGCSDFPIIGGFNASHGTGMESVLAKVSPDSDLLWSTYIGGHSPSTPDPTWASGETISQIILRGDAIWIAGCTSTTDFPTTAGLDQTLGGNSDAFVTKLTSPRPVITAAPLPDGYTGEAYQATLSCSAHNPPITWRIVSGTLPTGLSLDAGMGTISGTPQTSGTWAFTVDVRDRLNARSQAAYFAITVTTIEDIGGPITSEAAAVPTTVREKLDHSLFITCTADARRAHNYSIAAVEYSVSVGGLQSGWQDMSPSDGAFNSPFERASATIDTSSWRVVDGPVSIAMRAVDSHGRASLNTPSITVDVVDGTPPGKVVNFDLTPTAALEKVAGSPWRTAGTVSARDESKTFDLGASVRIGAVSMTPDRVSVFPQHFSIEASADAGTWVTLSTQSVYRAAAGANVFQFDPARYRYVRLTATSVYDGESGCYSVSAADVSILGAASGGRLLATWNATADDGTEAASGAAASYDLRYSFSPITDANFDSCNTVDGLSRPRAYGKAEQAVFAAESRTGTVYAALRVADDAGNYSAVSNCASAQVSSGGLCASRESDELTVSPDLAPQLIISRGEDITQAYIEFSDRPDFPPKRASGMNATLGTARFALKAGVECWSPTAAQWRMIKKLASNGGTVYWRLQGRSASFPKIATSAKSLLFGSAGITGLAVPGAHGESALWPDADTLPTFSWTNGIAGMVYFWVDVSVDNTFSSKGPKKIISFAGRSSSAAPSNAQWKAIRRLAATNGGILYWRVRAKDQEKALTLASQAQTLTIDGGTWTISDVASTPDGPMISWEHKGEGIVRYRLEFTAAVSSGAKPGTTVIAPAASLSATSYTLKPAEVARLRSLARRANATALNYRVRGEDAQKAFLTYSDAKTMPVP
jgi:hypothetical protein